MLEESHFSFGQPFGQSNKIVKTVAYEGGLGDTLGLKGTRALSFKMTEAKPFRCGACGYEGGYACPKCHKEYNDKPMRANLLMMTSHNFEHPKLRSIRKFLSIRATEMGFGERGNSDHEVVVQRAMKRASAVTVNFIIRNSRARLPKQADMALALAILDIQGQIAFENAKQRLRLADKDVLDFERAYRTNAREIQH